MASSLFKQVGKTLYWFPTAFFATTHFYDIKTVSGRSMQVSLSCSPGPAKGLHEELLISIRKPTLNPDSSPLRDVAIFSKYSVRSRPPNYGRDDIVIFRSVPSFLIFLALED